MQRTLPSSTRQQRRRSLCASLLLILAVLMTAPASAGDTRARPRPLRDPTRPLATLPGHAPAPVASAASGLSVGPEAASAAPSPSAPPVLPRLQLVLVSGDRRHAVIDDTLLTEGDSLRGLRVLSILSDAVILATPAGPRTLRLPTDNE